MAELSPIPWAADPDDREGMSWNIQIVQASNPNMRVCFMTSGPEAVPNAAFIVKAVNSHDALVKALQRARLFIDGLVQETEFKHRQPALGGRQELEAIDAALQEAGR